MAKHIFVTGGVVSSLGKGITAASLGHLLKARGYKVTMQKMDPYLNVDPGTMSPFQHGEVFVPTTVKKPISIWDIMNASSMKASPRNPTSLKDRSIKHSSRESVAAIFSVVPCRSFRT